MTSAKVQSVQKTLTNGFWYVRLLIRLHVGRENSWIVNGV